MAHGSRSMRGRLRNIYAASTSPDAENVFGMWRLLKRVPSATRKWQPSLCARVSRMTTILARLLKRPYDIFYAASISSLAHVLQNSCRHYLRRGGNQAISCREDSECRGNVIETLEIRSRHHQHYRCRISSARHHDFSDRYEWRLRALIPFCPCMSVGKAYGRIR